MKRYMGRSGKNVPPYHCSVCFKRYYKSGAHNKCYKRYCILCSFAFPTEQEFLAHAQKWHPMKFCKHCQQVFRFIDEHRDNYHPTSC